MMTLRKLKELLADISDDDAEVRIENHEYGSFEDVSEVEVIDETKEVRDPSKGPFYIGPGKTVKTGRKLVVLR
jgi:hypothetical protein